MDNATFIPAEAYGYIYYIAISVVAIFYYIRVLGTRLIPAIKRRLSSQVAKLHYK